MFTPMASSSCSLSFRKRRDAAKQCYTAARNDAFLNRRARGVHGVFHARLLLLQLGLGCGPHLDHCHAADQLGQTLLQLFLVVVRGGVLDLRAELLDAALDLAGFARALDDRGVVLVDDHFLGAAELFDLHVFELDAKIFGDGFAAGQNGDVFEHFLAAIAKARSLHRNALQGSAELVHDQRRQRFAFDIFRNNQQRLARSWWSARARAATPARS